MATVEGIYELGDGFDADLDCLGDVSMLGSAALDVVVAMPTYQSLRTLGACAVLGLLAAAVI